MSRLHRRLLRPRELAGLLTFRTPAWSATRRRLATATTIGDLRAIAKRRTPSGPFDYTDGAADDEVGLARARRAFSDVQFLPRVLRDVSDVDTSTVILGCESTMPFGFAPTGFTRMMHASGERAVAAAAARAGIPYALSTVGTTSITDVRAAAPDGRHWFQLYMFRDRELTARLLRDAAEAGFAALLVTVDSPSAGKRVRDLRNGMTIPPQLTLRTLADASYRPAWWINFLTTEPYRFAYDPPGSAMADVAKELFDPSLDFADLAWIREHWSGPIIVKGVQNADDARRSLDSGADGIVVSSHGGRQLDRGIPPLHLLPGIRAAVGHDAVVMLDSGVMNGGDIVAALASGADFVLVGRAYLYGLMAGAEAGVTRAFEILAAEVTNTMRLLGVTSVGDLSPDAVRLVTPDGQPISAASSG